MSNQPTIEQLVVERDHLAAMIVAQMAGRPATASGQARAWRWNQYDIGQYEALSAEIARRGEPVQQGRLVISAGGAVMAKRYAVHLCGTREYKPGDPEPEGYMEWHEWAGVQHKAGLRQQQCGQCGRWWYPQQLSDQVCVSNPVKGNGQVVEIRSPVCKSCAEVR